MGRIGEKTRPEYRSLKETVDISEENSFFKAEPAFKDRFWVRLRAAFLLVSAAGFVGACSSSPTEPPVQKAKFSPQKYGVKASPRVVENNQPVPKGGGRYVVGKRYKIAGKWYYPKYEPNYKNKGMASWYGPTFHGRKTANGEVFDRNGLTAAHTTMPLPSYAKVTNLSNGRSMIVRVNDRGPFHNNRIIDLSERVATMLGTKSAGVSKVKVEYVGRAPLHGQDEDYLMASYNGPGAVRPGATRPGTQLALAGPRKEVPLPTFGFGPVPTPSARPYTAERPQPYTQRTVNVAFDPAISFERGVEEIDVASNEARPQSQSSPIVILPAPEVSTDIQRAPLPGRILPESSISSYTANNRISGAHLVFENLENTGLSMTDLVKRLEEEN